MRAGAHGFLMVADYRKYNAFMDSLGDQNALLAVLPKRRYPAIRHAGTWLIRRFASWDARRHGCHDVSLDEDDVPGPGRWYHAGTVETCSLLRDVGFTVLDADMGVDPRSPIIHFSR